MKQCAWTGAVSKDVVAVSVPSKALASLGQVWVLPEHEQELRAYAEHVDARGRLVTAAVIGLSILLALAAVLGSRGVISPTLVAPTVGGLLVVMGAVMIALPISTTQTMEAFGIRRSIQVVRWLGAITIVLGAGIAVVA